MKNKTNMAELMKKVRVHGQPQNLDEGFASDAQRREAHKVIRQKVKRTRKMKKSLMRQRQHYPDLVETD